jgi:hypothetical protein
MVFWVVKLCSLVDMTQFYQLFCMSLKNDLVSGGKSYTVLESTHELCGHCMYQFLNITDVF